MPDLWCCRPLNALELDVLQFYSILTSRYIETADGQIPVGVFLRRTHVVKATLKQLLELKAVHVPDDPAVTRVVLHMTYNQGMDGAGTHPEIFSKDAVNLSKVGHSLKSCQTVAFVLINCSTATEVQV